MADTYVETPQGRLIYRRDTLRDKRRGPYELRYENGQVIGYSQPPRRPNAPWKMFVWGTPEDTVRVFPDLAGAVWMAVDDDRLFW